MSNSNEQSQGHTKKCTTCQEDVQLGAKKCKHCRTDLRNWFIRHKILTGFLVLFVIAIIGSTGNNPSNDLDIPPNTITTQQEEVENGQNETLSQKNAIRSAKSYLDTAGFSRNGLIKQLEFEKFSHEDAVYAVDNVGADWNAQAERSAKSYLDVSGFSRDGLIRQLEFEGFTNEQAVYGVDAVGL